MIKCYPEHSTHRAQLAEAITLASKIATCEPNEQTIRATVMYCLERNVEGFPVRLAFLQRLSDWLTNFRPISSATIAHTSTLSMSTSRS